MRAWQVHVRSLMLGLLRPKRYNTANVAIIGLHNFA